MSRIRFATLLLIYASIYFQAIGQETSGGLTGKISDSKSQYLPGATVTAVHLPSGTHYATRANEDGRYALLNMRIGGPYSVEVSLIGMTSQSKGDVQVSLGEPSTLNFVLAESSQALSEVVVRAARTGALANATGAGTNISSRQLRDQPAAARALQDYTKLTPQFNGNSFAGTNFRYNNISIDGAINNDAIGFSPSLGGQTGTSGQPGSSTRTNSFSIDAIQDIQVYVAPYDVKIGNFTGGSINAVTRSGTNQVTGSLYGYGRSSAVTGPDNVQQTGKLTGFNDGQTGFRLGFPIIKNRLFWFTNEEVTRRVDPLTERADTRLPGGTIFNPGDAERIAAFIDDPSVSGTLAGGMQFRAGTAGDYSIHSNSSKFFNRFDWNVASGHQLSVRNNVVISEATNLTRDEQNFRFSSIDYLQRNRQNSTVAELKSHFSAQLDNSLVVGYSSVHDFRDPLSYAYYPQIQIAGRTAGTTILLGTDREAAVFDLRQRTLELTDNFTYTQGRHRLTFGTHNELYGITYNFVNSPNGRVDYPSIEAFLAKQPSRIRGSYNYTDASRAYIFQHPSAKFNVNLFSAYAQDEIQVNDRLRITPGLRVDLAVLPSKQSLSIKAREATADVNYGRTYGYTPAGQINNGYLGNLQLSPRFGFNYDANGDKTLVLRGGTGLFTGRIPFAWLGYAYYNNGDTYGSFDRNNLTYVTASINDVPNSPAPGTDPQRISPDGIASTVRSEYLQAGLSRNGQTQIDLIDNRFKMPKVWRTSAAADFTFAGGYKLTLEGIYTKTLNDVKFQQLNVKDSASYYYYDRFSQQPIFNSGAKGIVDPSFSALYLLSNTHEGYRYSGTVQLRRTFAVGLDLSTAYTYGVSKDISNGIRNSLESNWQLNQSLNPNNPSLAFSNFDIRHRVILSISYARRYGSSSEGDGGGGKRTAGGRFASAFNLFFSATSGQPFTYGFVNASIQGTQQQVSLAYIPKGNEYVQFFDNQEVTLPSGEKQFFSKEDQAQNFFQFISSVPYLASRQGKFTERNAARTPWNTSADFRFSQSLFLSSTGRRSLVFTWDIINLTALINKNWGRAYFSSDLFNSTASVGLTPKRTSSGAQQTRNGFPLYTFSTPAAPYQTDTFASRWQMQFGLRYNF